MSRPYEVPGFPANKVVTVRMQEGMVEALDARRGAASRGAFIRALLRKELKGKGSK